jgi:DNA-binding CsgD family transcriptional regulator
VRRALDGLLRSTLHHDVGALSTIDPATNLFTSCYVSGAALEGGAAREQVIFDIEFLGDDPNSYRELAHAHVPVGRLLEKTDGDLSRARRYSALLEPLGVTDEMRVVLRAHGSCWGSLTLYRRAGSPPFSAADESVAADAAPVIADLFRLTMLRAALAAPAALKGPPGLILIAADGTVSTTEAASAWVDAIDDRGRLPSVLHSVAAAARAGDALARAAVPTRDAGWVVLHGSTLGDDVAVIVEGARPPLLSAVIAGAYGFTPREQEVTGLLAQGLNNKTIAARLSLSPFTVQDHVKSVLAKAGVQSRGELVALLFADHYQPRRDSASTPSPYGWYLDDELPVAI